MSGLVVSNVGVRLGEATILSGVGFAAPAGQVTGLIGPNGAGKSTLLTAMLGMHRLESGTVFFDDADLANMTPPSRARLCAYVEQSAATTERLTVRDVVSLGRVPFQTTWQTTASAEDDFLVDAALADMGVTGFAGRLYHNLSGGEQQRVQMARALAQSPKLLLLDEPIGHLDIRAQLQVLDLLRRRAAAGCTIVVALHDLNLAARFCDHLVVLAAGHLAAEGPPAEVLGAALLLEVYGVHAEIIERPGSPYPLIVYDRAETASPTPESG